jgi:hypothetical protein
MSFKPGDLVMIVKPRLCCGNRDAIGRMGTVSGVMFSAIARCTQCGNNELTDSLVPLVGGTYVEPSRLIKIDPLTEQDKTETLQEVTA